MMDGVEKQTGMQGETNGKECQQVKGGGTATTAAVQAQKEQVFSLGLSLRG